MIAIHATTFATMRRFLSRRSDGSGCRSARQSAYSVIIGASLEDNSKTSGSLAAVSSTSRSLTVIRRTRGASTSLLRQTTIRHFIFQSTILLKSMAQQLLIVSTAMLRLFESKIESNLRISSTICDYAWLRQTERSTRSRQDQLSAFRQKDFPRRTNIFRRALR
jgi:hypothetical protein